MRYTEIAPRESLKAYVKCYYLFESETHTELQDTVFPAGQMEIIFNLGEGIWKSSVNNEFLTTPQVELWGQITQPLAIKSFGKHTMLGIRFYAHSAACFLNEEVWEFNDQVSDLRDLLGASVQTLHSRLMDTSQLNERIALIESFLLNRLSIAQKRSTKISMIGKIMNDMQSNAFSDQVDATASRYDITPRYLQKLFLQYTGITPKLYSKINRFQRSLRLIARKEVSFTSIAYDCGYFDQSHFIREFKSFTGMTPSAYMPESYPVAQVLSNN